MYKFKILIEGYARAGEGNVFFASPTTILLTDEKGEHILVDPGTNSKLLKESLMKENVNPEDIKRVFLSHYHPDHFLNLKLFPNTEVIDGTMVWREDEEIPYEKYIPGTDIEVLQTPGHASEFSSLFINTEDMGVVAISQDVFWWEDGNQKSETVEDLMNANDPFANDLDALKASRELVLSKADWIIPGHGKIFKNPKK